MSKHLHTACNYFCVLLVINWMWNTRTFPTKIKSETILTAVYTRRFSPHIEESSPHDSSTDCFASCVSLLL